MRDATKLPRPPRGSKVCICRDGKHSKAWHGVVYEEFFHEHEPGRSYLDGFVVVQVGPDRFMVPPTVNACHVMEPENDHT